MPSGEQVVGVTVAATLVIVFVAVIIIPAAQSAQSELSVTVDQTEGETRDVYGPIEATLDEVNQTAETATVTVSNNDTGRSETTTVALGGTETVSIPDDVTVRFDERLSDTDARLTYSLDRDAFLQSESRDLLGILLLFLFLGGLFLAAGVLKGVMV